MKSTIKASYDCKEDTIIGFNYKYLLDMLAALESKEATLKYKKSEINEPVCIKENNSIYLIMRLNITNNDGGYNSNNPFSNIRKGAVPCI